MSNVVRCGNGVATRRQAKLIRKLDEDLAMVYRGKTVKDASNYITSSLLIKQLEYEDSMDAWYEAGEHWGDQ